MFKGKRFDRLTAGGFDRLTAGGFDRLTAGGFDRLTAGEFDRLTPFGATGFGGLTPLGRVSQCKADGDDGAEGGEGSMGGRMGDDDCWRLAVTLHSGKSATSTGSP
jgi:hypothetical protein